MMKESSTAQIITGKYPTADEAQKNMVEFLFGDNSQQKYEVYFHRYNIVHELGHGIFENSCEYRPHPADEEQLVNNFAVAYLNHYSTENDFTDFCSIVKKTLGRFKKPTDKGFMEYAKDVWGSDELLNFNNYGWFQFSCVNNAVLNLKPLDEALRGMGVKNLRPQEKSEFLYDINEDMPAKVLADAVRELRAWGAVLPGNITVVQVDDPNCHMYVSKDD